MVSSLCVDVTSNVDMAPEDASSYSLPEDEPLEPTRAKVLISEILKTGSVSFSRHARDEMKKDKLESTDATNVLRAGKVEPGELDKGTWRYRICTPQIVVVISFRSSSELRVVTAWRRKT